MKSGFLFTLGAVFLGLAASASAAAIISTTISGPGGTGTDGNSPGSNTTQPNIIFNNINFLDIALAVDSAGNYNFNQAPGLGGTYNNTGVAWTGFELTITSNNGATFTNSVPPFFWETYPGFVLANFTPTKITFTQPVAPATSFAFFGYINTTGPGTVTVRQLPTPEPGSVALLGLGCAGLGFVRRRQA